MQNTMVCRTQWYAAYNSVGTKYAGILGTEYAGILGTEYAGIHGAEYAGIR